MTVEVVTVAELTQAAVTPEGGPGHPVEVHMMFQSPGGDELSSTTAATHPQVKVPDWVFSAAVCQEMFSAQVAVAALFAHVLPVVGFEGHVVVESLLVG